MNTGALSASLKVNYHRFSSGNESFEGEFHIERRLTLVLCKGKPLPIKDRTCTTTLKGLKPSSQGFNHKVVNQSSSLSDIRGVRRRQGVEYPGRSIIESGHYILQRYCLKVRQYFSTEVPFCYALFHEVLLSGIGLIKTL